MQALAAGVKTVLDTLATQRGVYLDIAPEKAEMPFVVFSVGTSTVEHMTEGDVFETFPVLVSVYDTSAPDAATIMEAAQSALYDPFDVSSEQVMETAIGSSSILVDPDKGDDGQEVWHAVTQVDVMVYRTIKPGS